MALEKELATYKEKLPELLAHSGQFVLIHADEVIDFFSAYDDAIKQGYRLFKLEPFLVKQIEATETVQYVTRCVEPYLIAEAS